MSTPLPTKEQANQAQAFMVNQIDIPAFFEKLAANGLEPQNDAEARQLLELGAVLAQAEANGQVKRASDEGNPFLSHVLTELRQQTPAAAVDDIVKQGADRLVAESELAKTAALIYAHAQSGGELANDESADDNPSE